MQRVPFDVEAYARRVQSSSCFICEVVADPGNDGWHEVVAETEENIAFLGKYPTSLGHVLVAPKSITSMWSAISARMRTFA
ncbi:hypothetical protein [Nocardia cerradoensis]|uniref:hypothetical protein n=1 Tax=Nocardia cerradoensis TaxID=85688 RepID=UPI0002D88083|nr:hypothetical protein [Nocardia cerradoensis]NKY43406.1 hypothetical protein [Nocardia cerradoensis]